MLQSLSHDSDGLLVGSDNASSLLVKVRESELELRLTNVRQLLMSRESVLGSLDAESSPTEFHRVCGETEQVCEQVETTLGDVALSDGTDEATLTTLMTSLDRSLTQLAGHRTVHLPYIVPLGITDSERLQHLHSRSHDLLCRTKDRCRAVHRRLLTHYSTARRCHEWLQFVAPIERELSCSLAGNFDALLAQQKTFEASSINFLTVN